MSAPASGGARAGLPDDVLAGLWRAVAHVASGRVAVLERALQALLDGDADAAARCADGVEEAHKLVGSLDSYARTGGSALALRAATLLDVPVPDLAEVGEVVRALRRTVDGTVDAGTVDAGTAPT